MDLPSTLGLETESKPDLENITGVLTVSKYSSHAWSPRTW
jgi:hypothetical protein